MIGIGMPSIQRIMLRMISFSYAEIVRIQNAGIGQRFLFIAI